MGFYRHKKTGTEIEAFRHDGDDHTAKDISAWVNLHKGRAVYHPKGTIDYDLHQAFVELDADNGYDYQTVVLERGMWVLRVGMHFYVVSGKEFDKLYVPIVLGEK